MNDVKIKFEKVPFTQFYDDMLDIIESPTRISLVNLKELIRKTYDNIQLPKRSTPSSAGFDFFIPFDATLAVHDVLVIPTGIRAIMPDNVYLGLYPRSGLGFKYRTAMANTIGIVDSDYAYSKNNGHIKVELIYDGIDKNCRISYKPDGSTFALTGSKGVHRNLSLEAGDRFCQGIFMTYLTDGVAVDTKREGGFGSTDNK